MYQRERDAYLRSRPCVIDGCDELIPCPSHGEPAEDRGDWFRASGALLMGRASRIKRERRRTSIRTAHVEVVCPGMLEVLSVGKGDIKLTIGGPGEVDDARRIIEEMLRKGYGIFVETDAGLRRVKKFNPKRMTYVISEVVEEPASAVPAAEPSPEPARPHRPRRTRDREVAVAGSRAKAIGRTAGG